MSLVSSGCGLRPLAWFTDPTRVGLLARQRREREGREKACVSSAPQFKVGVAQFHRRYFEGIFQMGTQRRTRRVASLSRRGLQAVVSLR
jgi:hypothetical protein